MAYTQQDLNLAINYTLIEKILDVMGIKNTVYEEYPSLEEVINAAKEGELSGLFKSFSGTNGETIKNDYLSVFGNLFGLSITAANGEIKEIPFDEDLLLGNRQINPGIKLLQHVYKVKVCRGKDGSEQVLFATGHEKDDIEQLKEFLGLDEQDQVLERERVSLKAIDYLSCIDHQELNDYLEECLKRDPTSIVSRFRFDIDEDEEKLIEGSMGKLKGKSLGKYTLNPNEQYANELEKIKSIYSPFIYNPLGINTEGVFVSLLISGLIDIEPKRAEKDEAKLPIADWKEMTNEEKVWSLIFRNTTAIYSTRKTSKNTMEEQKEGAAHQVGWTTNLYSLESLIYFALRNHKKKLKGLRNITPKEYKYGANNLKIFDRHHTVLPIPLVFDYQESDLAALLQSMFEKYDDLVDLDTLDAFGDKLYNQMVDEIDEEEVATVNAMYETASSLDN